MTPASVIGAALPRHAASSWEVGRRYNHMVLSGVLVEDSSTGRVRRGPFGMALPTYDITDYDHERFVNATRWLAEMHFSMGAQEVHLPFMGLHVAHSADDLVKIDPAKIRPQDLEMFTPHLMGTARMGTDAKHSVVDLNGALWDLPGCYVADASVFPTAIGVNPQVTIMALARRIGRRLVERLHVTTV
jgi:choline dehydrogenase-like flavoprotein